MEPEYIYYPADELRYDHLRNYYGILEVKEPHAELDLGCGSGSFTVALACRYPESRIYAADMLKGRLKKLIKRADSEYCFNIYPMQVEARYLLGRLIPDGSFDRIHLLCPDPWPKDRHRGHRLLTSDFTTHIHRVLKKDGIFHFSSDDVNYCNAVGRILEASGLFVPFQEGIEDIKDIRSDFEKRWRNQGLDVPHRAWKKVQPPVPEIGH